MLWCCLGAGEARRVQSLVATQQGPEGDESQDTGHLRDVCSFLLFYSPHDHAETLQQGRRELCQLIEFIFPSETFSSLDDGYPRNNM
jgi:hypothetical protein